MDSSIIAALIAVIGVVFGYLIGQRQTALERKRILCAEAISDALQWLELPYRIRRRTGNADETLASLAKRINHLRERLQFHEKWLRIEMPKSLTSYKCLVKEVMTAARPAIEEAWNACPVESATDMNLGLLEIGREKVDVAVERFSSDAVKALTWWRIVG